MVHFESPHPPSLSKESLGWQAMNVPALARKGEATWPSHCSCLHPGRGHRQTRWPQMGKEVKPSAPWPGCDRGDDFHERPDCYPL